MEKNKKVEDDIKKVLRELKDKYTANDYIFGISEDEISNLEENEDDFEIKKENVKPSYVFKMKKKIRYLQSQKNQKYY